MGSCTNCDGINGYKFVLGLVCAVDDALYVGGGDDKMDAKWPERIAF
jgi:hypothetical protein